MGRLLGSVLLFVLFAFMGVNTAAAQQISPVRPPAQDQRYVDEQLAWSFFNNRQWDKALPIFERLYQKYQATQYYTSLFECMVQLMQYDDAGRLARKAFKNQNNFQAAIDMAYVKQLKGQIQEANADYSNLIRSIPADRNLIMITANSFRTRGLNEQALETYVYGAGLSGMNYDFNLEKAYLYQLTGDYPAMMDAYLRFLATNPEQIEMVKSRIQSLSYMDVDNNLGQIAREKILQKAQQNPDVTAFGELLIWYSLQEKDYAMALIQAKAMDRRFGDMEHIILDISEICLNNDISETALDGFAFLLQKGRSGLLFRDAELGSIQARYRIETSRPNPQLPFLSQIVNDVNQVFEQSGFNTTTYRLAFIQASIEAYYLNQAPDAIALLQKTLQLPLSPLSLAEAKMQLADILFFTSDVWEATLLYSQIDKALKNEPIGHEARFRNARLRYFIGEFSWAQTQLDVLKAATSKLIANDALQLSLLISDALAEDSTGLSLRAFAKADLLTFRKNIPAALHILDSLSINCRNNALKPHILLKQAELQLLQGQSTEAEQLLVQLFTSFPDHYLADDALYRSALLNEEKHELETALKRYEWIIEKYPSSVFSARARQKFRQLRNEIPQP